MLQRASTVLIPLSTPPFRSAEPHDCAHLSLITLLPTQFTPYRANQPPLKRTGEKSGVKPEGFLNQVVQVTELLVEKEPEIYEFSHLSFQEFLAALEIVRLRQESILYDQLQVDVWKPTILFYSYLVNPTKLIREAIRQGAVQLADQMWRETPRRIDLSAPEEAELKTLRYSIQNAKYHKLEELLQAQQWREADKETYRLMITTVDKEEGQWFDSKELTEFPCEDLRVLDGLWVKYSNGHFGFSVQKKIWQEYNSPTKYNYDWKTFCNRVGWYVKTKDDWIESLFELPVGNLPTGWVLMLGMDDVIPLWVFFSRAQTCEL